MVVQTESGGEPVTKSGPYFGNGVSAVLDYEFPVLVETELEVRRLNASGTETVLALTTHYTVQDVGVETGGTITLVDPATDFPTGTQIVILYDGEFDQNVRYSSQGGVDLALFEDSLDSQMMHLRQLKEEVDRSVKTDAFGAVDVDTLVANVNALAAIEADVSTVAGIAPNVTTVAGIAGDVTAVAAIAGDVSAVAAGVTLAENATTIVLTGGTSTAYTLAAAVTITAYEAGQLFLLRLHTDTGVDATFNVDGLGAKDLKWYDNASALTGTLAGEWQEGQIVAVVYDGTRFVIATQQLFENTLVAVGGPAVPADLVVLSAGGVNESVTVTELFEAIDGLAVDGTPDGSADYVMTFDDDAGTVKKVLFGGLGGQALLHVREEQASGVNGGTSTSGSFQTRVLNTVKTNEITGASLAANVITLPAGTYWVEAGCVARRAQNQKSRLRNTTDATTAVVGLNTNVNTDDTSENTMIAPCSGRFTIAGAKAFELQHQVELGLATIGLGAAAAFGEVEVYSDVKIWKVL